MQLSNRNRDMTIREFADKIGLSVATVSRALNHHATVRPKTKQRVFEMAEELGYRLNDYARMLRYGRSHTIGCIVPRIDDHRMASILAGIELAARQEEYGIVVMQSANLARMEADCAGFLLNKRIDGLIVASPVESTGLVHFRPLIQKEIPIVLLDYYTAGAPYISLYQDNHQVGYEMTRHLLLQGRRRIVMAGPVEPYAAVFRRLEGYRLALTEAGVEFNQDFVLKAGVKEEDGVVAARRILEWRRLPDAFFAASDECAVGFMKTLKANGVRIPRDIAVAGTGNHPIGAVSDPRLTTIGYPAKKMGELAVTQLIGRLDELPGENLVDTMVLRGELIVRESSLKN